jgi:4,5-DOPA dioxygenase extradiol
MTLFPALFIGHGSPMHIVQEDAFRQSLQRLAQVLPQPECIVVISAHWFTPGTFVTTAPRLTTIYDFYGFPPELYAIAYTPPGCPALAQEICKLAHATPISADATRGIDHGAWAVLWHMYPAQQIPVIQLSLDVRQAEAAHYTLGKLLTDLRKRQILILGSGNVVHNLGRVDFEHVDAAFPWAAEFDAFVAQQVQARNADKLINYQTFTGQAGALAVPTNDHYLPLLYVEAVRQPEDQVQWVYAGIEHGSISMRSYLLTAEPLT